MQYFPWPCRRTERLPAYCWRGIQCVSGVTSIVPNGMAFPIKRGVKQRDPLFLLLFNITIVRVVHNVSVGGWPKEIVDWSY
jgi:hypothetical protein